MEFVAINDVFDDGFDETIFYVDGETLPIEGQMKTLRAWLGL